jgi:hypothetical protein
LTGTVTPADLGHILACITQFFVCAHHRRPDFVIGRLSRTVGLSYHLEMMRAHLNL